MKIIDILKENKLTLSFEVFPPKTETAFDSVRQATEEIASLSPAFMSVTYGAGGDTSLLDILYPAPHSLLSTRYASEVC